MKQQQQLYLQSPIHWWLIRINGICWILMTRKLIPSDAGTPQQN